MQRCARKFALVLAISLVVLGSGRGAFAQAFTLRGGYSNLFGAEGASVGFRGDHYSGWVGAGGVDGDIRLGAYLQTTLRGITVGAGDDSASLTLPTDIFTGGQYLLTRGVTLKAKRGSTEGFVFGGVSSVGYGAPWFQAAGNDTGVGMIFVDHQLSESVRLFTRNVISKRQTSISGLEWKPQTWLTTAIAGGMGAGQGYFSTSTKADWDKVQVKAGYVTSGESFRRVTVTQPATAEVDGANLAITFRPKRFLFFEATHQQYSQPAEANRAAMTATTNQASANVTVAGFRFGGNVFKMESNGVRGSGGGLTGGKQITRWLDVNSQLYRTQSHRTSTTTIFSTTVREQLHPRVALLQFVTHNGGQTSVSYGGEFVSNRLRLGIDYQNAFVPFDAAKPFRQAVNVNATVRPFGNLELHLGTFVDPFGRLRYTVWASNFIYRGRSGGAGKMVEAKMGRYVVRGHVVDVNGTPVAGAAVYVGDIVAYTDEDGRFFVRFDKPTAQRVRVATEEFTAPGYWEVNKVPASATPTREDDAVEIEIVVERLSPQAYHQRHRQEVPQVGGGGGGR